MITQKVPKAPIGMLDVYKLHREHCIQTAANSNVCAVNAGKGNISFSAGGN
ncbi:hypothetical protein [Vibrio sp. STUT-A11]|uniref:hypothetical protein n=1 Tax=unclassified Vibrio TaxID=2614977 RepID=UPI00222E6AAD|nr:hypothetical protein [Vibrio sp. STUT-A11]